MEKIETKSMLTIVIALIVGLALTPLIVSLVSDAQPYSYTTYQTLNSGFADNDTENCPAYWDNVTTDNRQINWDQPNERVWDNGDNGTSSWYQVLTVSSLSDGLYSATIKAKYRLYENSGMDNITAWVYLDDGTDNHLIWESTDNENTLTYISIENNISSYITAAGTYYIRFGENVSVPGDNDIITYWDDASLVVVTETETYTSAMLFAHLLPLFFVIGLVLTVVYWMKGKT